MSAPCGARRHEGDRGQVLQSYNALGAGYPFEYGPGPRIHVPGGPLSRYQPGQPRISRSKDLPPEQFGGSLVGNIAPAGSYVKSSPVDLT